MEKELRERVTVKNEGGKRREGKQRNCCIVTVG